MSPTRRTVTTLIAAATAAVVTAGVASVTAGPAVAAQPRTASAPVPTDPDSLTGPLAAELGAALTATPGGVQISDNAIAWEGGDVVMVVPSPGETSSPMGLGENVRTDVLRRMNAEHLASPSAYGPHSVGADDREVGITGSASSCPGGPFSRDWYCFYTDRSYEGSRFQFFDSCSGSASSWGFNNRTKSWVNRSGTNKSISTWDGAGSGFLWRMEEGTSSSYVGSADDNKMSTWTCFWV